MRFLNVIIAALLVISLIGCGESPVFAKKIKLDGKWSYNEKLVFPVDVENLDHTYDLILSVTYGTDFGYQNIYVKITTQYPSGKEDEDILSLNLTNGSGIFLGDCNSSECEIDLLLQEKFKFNEEGQHVIIIEQNGRTENLENVFAAELKLYRLQK